ncbi:MAG: ABC transporter ATP-binding protein [Jatrophihabitans sp.]|uniref:ABC transporter ATP-binding protein n=1 Tax=Jatrophihabitans sp. TaxID=1932789 RepID=UPI003F7D1783
MTSLQKAPGRGGAAGGEQGSTGPTGATGPTPARLPEAGGQARRGGGPPWMTIGMPAEKSVTFKPSAKRLIRRLRPERAGVIAVLVMAVCGVTLSVLGPWLLGRATNIVFRGALGDRLPAGVPLADVVARARAAGEGRFADVLESAHVIPGVGIDFTALGHLVLLVVGVYLASALLSWGQGYLLNGIVQRTVYRLRADVEDKLNRLPLPYFDQQPRGEILSRVTNDIDNVSTVLQQTLSQLLLSLLTVVGVVSMMLFISPLLAVIAVITIPVSMWLTKAIARRSQQQFMAQWKHTGALNGQIEEAFTGHELVTVFGRRHEVEQRFAERNEALYEASFGAQFVSGIIMPTMMFLGNLNYVLVAVVGGLRVASGAMTLGEVQAFIQYSRQFTQPLTQVASMANLLQSGVASAERVFDLLDADEQRPDPVAAERPTARRGRVEFEHVGFRYLPDVPLIDDLSLVAEPGQTIAIVGPTGAGKTTLVNLIMRFYELDSGRILLDGVDIAGMTRDDLRGEIGMVLQDTWLFGGTIRDNIAYGRPGASEAEILAAAQATYVDRFVQALPHGYDTVLDEQSGNLSVGQKQLITIARAFLAQPSLLILDEATSAVDTRTEVLVQHAMAALRRNRTSFVIAHRLSTIRDADLILVMQQGRIVEQGTHAQLLERGGAYADLYNAQFEAPTGADADDAVAPESAAAGPPGAAFAGVRPR